MERRAQKMVEKGITVCQSHGFVLRTANGGVEVSRVLPHGPKDLQMEDSIVSINGKSVATAADAKRILDASIGVEQQTELEVSRGSGRVQEIVNVMMPCPAAQAEDGQIESGEKKKGAFSFARKDKTPDSKDEADACNSLAPATPDVQPAVELSEAEQEKTLGNQAFKDSLWEDAIMHFTAAIDLSPKPAPNTLYSNRAAAYLQAGKAKEALMDAVKSTEGFPDFAKGHYRAGQALLDLERHTEAIVALNRALQCDPNNVQIYGALSRAQNLLEAAQKAKEEAKEAAAEKKAQKEAAAAKRALQLTQKQSASGIKEATQAFADAKTNDASRAAKTANRNAPPPPSHGVPTEEEEPTPKMGGWGMGKKTQRNKKSTMWGDEAGVLGGGETEAEAEKAKEEGNKAFAKGDFALAAENFTLAINLDPNNHVYCECVCG